MSDKVDFKKSLDSYQARRGEFRVVDVPSMRYLMVDGAGDPNSSSEFTTAIETLYPVAYKLKFASKNEFGRDYVVPPLEGLWWAEDMSVFTRARDKTRWNWTLMLMVPDWIGEDLVTSVVGDVRIAKSPPRIDDLRLDRLDEGLCVQTLHIGSFDAEGPVLATMHEEFLPANGFRLRGIHHEIYLSDFRKSAPERLRTILRQPVERTATS